MKPQIIKWPDQNGEYWVVENNGTDKMPLYVPVAPYKRCRNVVNVEHGLRMALAWLRNQGIREDRMPKGVDSYEELQGLLPKI